jgi:hypothetical protein
VIVDHVARALLSAMMILEDIVDGGQEESRIALNALESIAHELGKMTSEERAGFIDALDRVASTEEEPELADWIRSVPRALGLVPRT